MKLKVIKNGKIHIICVSEKVGAILIEKEFGVCFEEPAKESPKTELKDKLDKLKKKEGK